ncbi:unnamed protein product [Lampetra planeri]
MVLPSSAALSSSSSIGGGGSSSVFPQCPGLALPWTRKMMLRRKKGGGGCAGRLCASAALRYQSLHKILLMRSRRRKRMLLQSVAATCSMLDLTATTSVLGHAAFSSLQGPSMMGPSTTSVTSASSTPNRAMVATDDVLGQLAFTHESVKSP